MQLTFDSMLDMSFLLSDVKVANMADTLQNLSMPDITCHLSDVSQLTLSHHLPHYYLNLMMGQVFRFEESSSDIFYFFII